MRKLKFAVAMAFACAILIGCAAPRSVVDPSWTQKPGKVKVVFTEPFVANPDDLQDDLPDYVNNFPDWFKAQVEANIGKYSSGVNFSVERISADMVSAEAASLDGVNIKVPKIKQMDNDADIYLVLNDVWFGRTEAESACAGSFGAGGVGGGMMVGGCVSKQFTAKGNFAYFDVKTGKRVAYGDFEANSSYTFAVSQGDWESVVLGALDKMLSNTPLK